MSNIQIDTKFTTKAQRTRSAFNTKKDIFEFKEIIKNLRAFVSWW
jgi:hypothetical protein